MTKLEKVIEGLKCWTSMAVNCDSKCAYKPDDEREKCVGECDFQRLCKDALDLLEATKPAKLMAALYDVRDRWIARLPKSEWYRDKKAQGVEQGIEMCIKRMSEVLYGNE